MADLKRLRQNHMTNKNSRRLAHLLQNNGIISSSLDRYGSCEDSGNSPDLDFKVQNSENACFSNKGRESRLSYSSEDLYCPFCMCNFLSELKHALHMQVHGVTYYEEEEEEDVDDRKDEPKNIQIMVPNENLRAHPPTPSPQETDQIMIFPISNTGKESKTVKPKSAAKRAACKNSNPPLTLVIKKSKTQYEVQRTEEPPVPVSPAVQLRGENCDIQSDSATETIDIESSSPSGSPSSIQSDMPNSALDKSDSGKRFCCPECQKQYPTKYALKRHRVTHSEERPFACTFPGCQSTFKLKPRLTDHIRTVHNHKNSRKAKKRSKSLPDTNPASSSLAQALLIPSTLSAPNSALPTLPTEQPVNETSSTSGSNGVTAAVGAVSNGKSSAKAHPHKCPVPNCNRDFRNLQDLESHMCLHTGQKPLKCSLCKYVAIQKVQMDFHMKSAHPGSL